MKAIIRLEDGKTIIGNIFIRNTINRAKDELNAKEGKFIIVSNVRGPQNQILPETYYINKDHVIYFAVRGDTLSQ